MTEFQKKPPFRDGCDPFSEAVLFNEIENMAQSMAVRASFAENVYPDQAAMEASNRVSDLLERIDEDTLTDTELTDFKSRHIDYTFVRDSENGRIPQTHENILKQSKEINKVKKYVSDITKIPVSRINKATKFWIKSTE